MSITRARVGSVAAVAAAGLVVVGCGSSGGGSPTGSASSPPSQTASSQTAPSQTASSLSSPSATPTPTSTRVVGPTGNASQPLTKPGTALRLGQPAYIEVERGDPGDDYHSKSIVKVTVTEIRKGSPADFSRLKNAAEFKGFTPYYIESTDEIIYFEGYRVSKPDVNLKPIGKGRTGSVITFGVFDKCRSTRYDYDETVGATQKPCKITAAASGGMVTGAKYEGEDSSDDYYKSPITWGSGE